MRKGAVENLEVDQRPFFLRFLRKFFNMLCMFHRFPPAKERRERIRIRLDRFT